MQTKSLPEAKGLKQIIKTSFLKASFQNYWIYCQKTNCLNIPYSVGEPDSKKNFSDSDNGETERILNIGACPHVLKASQPLRLHFEH